MTDDNTNTSLTKPGQMPSIGFGKRGLAAKREQVARKMAELNPLEVPHRIGIEFDDSGSMSGKPLEDAKDAVREFTSACNPLETSITIFPMNESEKPLTCDFDLVNLFVRTLNKLGSTPLYTVLKKMLDVDLTKAVVFSDGSPTDSSKDEVIAKALAKKINVDTVFIGYGESDSGYKEMKELAEKTGGMFVHFKDTKSLRSGLKYLTPGLCGLLANPEIKAKIERGETI